MVLPTPSSSLRVCPRARRRAPDWISSFMAYSLVTGCSAEAGNPARRTRRKAGFQLRAQPLEAGVEGPGAFAVRGPFQALAQVGQAVELFHDVAVHRFLLAFDMR